MAYAPARGFGYNRRGQGEGGRRGERRVGSGRFPGSDERENNTDKGYQDKDRRGRALRGNGGANVKSPTGSRKSHKPSPLHFHKLRRMITADPTDAVLDLLKHEGHLQNILEDEHMKDDFIELLLEILVKVYDTHMKENLMKIMTLFPNTVFLRTSLSRYIMQLSIKGRNTEKHVENIILFFDQMLRRFPDNYGEIPLDSFVVASMTLGQQVQPEVLTRVEALVSTRQQIIENKSKPRSKVKKTEEAKPPDDFREISVYPTTDDLEVDKFVFLRKNIVESKYHDVTHYLDVQFRLLREDFIGPLREGVNEIARDVGRDERNQNLRIYRNVEIVDTVCTNSGIVFSVRFDARPLRRVNWENSKRLIFGAFLCLSKDNFRTLVFATITERKAELLKNGFLQVRFLGDLPDVQRGDRFQMVESPGYYESYCHNLQGLQELSDDKMPFTRYLVHCETNVHAPKYVTEVSGQHNEVRGDDEVTGNQPASSWPRYDLQDVLQSEVDASRVGVLDPTTWPNVDDVELNQSQLDAIQAALTKEFVVIQGPPGTGKTYVGLKIVHALLNNQQYWREGQRHVANLDLRDRLDMNERMASPMLVVCYTNHALDQFLEGILKFNAEDIVRVGGRSDSELLKEYNLWNKARRTVAWYNVHDELKYISDDIDEEKKCLEMAYHRNLELKDLLSVIGEREINQMLPYVHVAAFYGTTVLRAWLNMEPLPFYAHENIGGVEGDMGFEEDDGLDDDDGLEDEVNEGLEENDMDQLGTAEENERLNDINNEATVDVEKEAERLQNERELGDDFAAIERAEDQARIGMTQDYLNLINLRARIAELEEEQRNQEQFVPPDLSLWLLDLNTRRQLYEHWVRRYQETHARTLEEHFQEYEVVCQQMKEIKHGQEEDALRRATVIGMTTTGAAKYRNVLQKIQPKIVVVEEAAQVLEAHIVTALSQGTEHLILIGDHKQLKPNPSVYTLAKQYNLEVSLFERMVRNGMKCHTLDTQHRMRPEIARLMKFIYDDLKNHVSVESFEDVLGVSKNIFFLDHQQPEKSDDELKSHSNEHEAKYIVALCQYLLRQGYDSSRITVLTTYTGQLLQLKRLMPKAQFQGVRLCTVDNFQGEENDIILLSLVRSNEENKIGFLGISNRICVALSRARMGFYCIGNITMLAGKSELWQKIKTDLEQQQAIGPALATYCQNHKNIKVEMVTAQDFKKAPEGGCTLPCDFRPDCGHKCEMVCHPVDREHREYICDKPCTKEVCSLPHRCTRICHHGKPCGPCQQPVIKTLPKCAHQVSMPCSDDVREFKCTRPCERNLTCGHPCRSRCGNECSLTKCNEKVEKTFPCGHKEAISCSTPIETYKCEVPCGSILECGHTCNGNCHDCKQGRIHVACQYSCGRTLICSHPCKEPCTKDCPPCQRNCENRCVHSACRKKCGEPCAPCQEPCTWKCKHKKCTKTCSEICDRKPCNVQCRRKLSCGHKCVGLCGEKCPRLCRVCDKEVLTEIFFGNEDTPRAKFIELLDCGHVFEVEALDQWMALQEENVTNIQLKSCPKCRTPIRKSLRYGNVIKKVLRDIETIKEKIKDNGVDSKKIMVDLNSKLSELRSKYPLVMMSSDANEERVESFFCSHPRKEPWSKDCPPCQRECENRCVHSACRKKCGEPCAPCHEPCAWKCKHKKCTKTCSEICDRKPCNAPCRRKLSCGHKCVGLCGEKCPRLCRVCDKEVLTEIFFGTEDTPRARFIELLDCRHVFEVEALDQWMALDEENVTNIQLKFCPKCKTPIRKSLRYGILIKILRDIKTIKKKVKDSGVDSKMADLNSKLSELRSKYPFVMKSNDANEENVEKRYRRVNPRQVDLPQMNSAYSTIALKIDSCSKQELGTLICQVQLLPSIYEIKTKFLERMQNSPELDHLRHELTDLEKFLMTCTKFTSQLMSDINQEGQRIALACKLKIVEQDIVTARGSVPQEMQLEIDAISALFDSTCKIQDEVRETAIKDLDKICKDLNLGSITAEERAEIVQAIGLPKGHWFKCRNGHIYAIADCGGAMERGVCPDCHEVIGGGDHRLEENNQFAPEMDGASYPAWSEQANLENYDQEELRRLQFL